MIVFLIVIFVISSLLLTVVILLQDDQGEGIGGLFGGGSGTAFGSRSGSVLTKFTSVLAAIFLVTAFAVAWLNRSGSEEDMEAKSKARALEEVEASDWYIRAGEASSGEEEPAAPEGKAAEASSDVSVESPEAELESIETTKDGGNDEKP